MPVEGEGSDQYLPVGGVPLDELSQQGVKLLDHRLQVPEEWWSLQHVEVTGTVEGADPGVESDPGN